VVVLAGWVHDVRLIGGLNFIILRDKEGFAQIVVRRGSVPEKLMELVRSLHQEDVIVVRGRVVPSREAKQGVELIPSELEVINRAASPLPLDPRDVTPASLETRLNWRHMDFRRAESAAIFRIQTEILRAFREFCLGEGFIEIQPPVIIGSASEGGAELFEIPYFDKKAYLAQSPQLYKQLCAISFERVFTVVPVFRAEKFEQPTHLNEIRQMDVEMAFADDEDAMNMLERCFHHILDHVRKNAARPLEILGRDLRVPTAAPEANNLRGGPEAPGGEGGAPRVGLGLHQDPGEDPHGGGGPGGLLHQGLAGGGQALLRHAPRGRPAAGQGLRPPI